MKKYIFFPVLILVFLTILFSFFKLNKQNILGPSGLETQIIPTVADQNQIPEATPEDIVRIFFDLIDENKVPDAIKLLSPDIVPEESIKQAWEIQLKSLKKVEVMEIKKQAEVEGDGEIYRVDLQVEVAPEAASAPIPYYGWSNGQNVRWVEVVKENNLWIITRIATGP